jgi:hypothetical protein
LLRGRLDSHDGASAMVAMWAARQSPTCAFVWCRCVRAGRRVRPARASADRRSRRPLRNDRTIVTHVYQGGRVDTYLACPDTPRDRVPVRWSGPDALSRWPIGATVGLTITSDDATAFAID